MASARAALRTLRVSSIEGLQQHDQGFVRVAGRIIMRQRPPTAKGVVFVTLEDETGIVQGIVYPKQVDRLRKALQAPAVVIAGRLQAQGRWRALIIFQAWPLPQVLGGYGGHLQMGGGRDSFAIREHETSERNHSGSLLRTATARV